MTTAYPLVSVLMTVYNREKYLAAAIQSVLDSSYVHFELIIVDDCSTDRSVAIANEYAEKDHRIRCFVNESNLGDYPNRNKAAGYAQGKYIKYVDADDTMYYYGLEVMVTFTEQFPEAGFGLGGYPDDDRPCPFLLSPHDIYLDSFYKTNHFDRAPGSGLIKTAAFQAIGGFSGQRMVGDFEFWLRLSRYYSMVKLPADLHWNRLHHDQESKTDYARKNYPILKKKILEDNFNHPDCPLSAEEIKAIRAKIKKSERKDKLLQALAAVNKWAKFT
ncbi:MAG TPA: glycosyltransferase family A protein [Puia sp.]|nr:glycosyltransferase family A protein [Puia sp.]